MVWTIVFIVLVVLIGAVWIGNTVRWTRKNGTLARRSPRWRGDSHLIDEQNRPIGRRDQQ